MFYGVPSYSQGYAAPASPWWAYAKYPELWKGIYACWAPRLGIMTGPKQGGNFIGKIPDVSNRSPGLQSWYTNNFWKPSPFGWCVENLATELDPLETPSTYQLSGWTHGTWFLRLRRFNHTATSSGQSGAWHVTSSDFNNHYSWTDGNIYEGTFRTTRQSIGAGKIADRTVWHTVAITSRPGSSGWKFWQNGREVFSATGDSSFSIGNGVVTGLWVLRSYSSSYLFNGQIAEAVLWKRELTGAELRLMSDCPNALYELEDWVGLSVAAAGQPAIRRTGLCRHINRRAGEAEGVQVF